MPTYEYECEACGHKFERFQSIKAEPVKKCPECGKNKVKRLIGIGAGMIFKGSGFYITDYRDKSYTEKAKAESGGGGATDAAKSSSEGKSDAKPATSDASSKPAETKAAGDSNSSSAPAPKSEPRASKSAKKK